MHKMPSVRLSRHSCFEVEHPAMHQVEARANHEGIHVAAVQSFARTLVQMQYVFSSAKLMRQCQQVIHVGPMTAAQYQTVILASAHETPRAWIAATNCAD